MIETKNKLCSASDKIRLNDNSFDDLNRWLAYMYMQVFNGSVRILEEKNPVTSMQTDACIEGGGGHFNCDYFYVNWNLDLPVLAEEHINVKETVTIVLALPRWVEPLRDKKVMIYTDNTSARAIINKECCRNPMVMYVFRVLF
jgi:hypothetical protein